MRLQTGSEAFDSFLHAALHERPNGRDTPYRLHGFACVRASLGHRWQSKLWVGLEAREKVRLFVMFRQTATLAAGSVLTVA